MTKGELPSEAWSPSETAIESISLLSALNRIDFQLWRKAEQCCI